MAIRTASARWTGGLQDGAGAFSTQPAHGHNFSGEHAAGWVHVLQPEGWAQDLTERLRQELARYP